MSLTPEQITRQEIDRMLEQAGWSVQDYKRINFWEQAEQEFMQYTPSDENRKFTELYPIQRLQSSYIAP